MSGRILDGNKIRDEIKAELANQIRDLKASRHHARPGGGAGG